MRHDPDQMEKIYNETPPTDIPGIPRLHRSALEHNQEEAARAWPQVPRMRRFAVIWRKRRTLSSVIRMRPGDHLLLIPKREKCRRDPSTLSPLVET